MTSKWIMIVIIAGFCAFAMGAAPGNAADGAGGGKARLVEIEKQSSDLSRKIQGCEYEKEKLRERHDAVTKEQVGYAADQKKLEEERAKILEELKKQEPAKP